MVKTKRAKAYKFTESKKKNKSNKIKEIKNINTNIGKYSNLYILELDNHNSQS